MARLEVPTGLLGSVVVVSCFDLAVREGVLRCCVKFREHHVVTEQAAGDGRDEAVSVF